jgi:hypothetical protein
MWTGHGTLLLFDNGNFRASPFDGTTPMTEAESFSRAVEYEIDEPQMHVRQLWEFGEFAEPRLYSWFISDADWQPLTGNRLITFGGISHVDGTPSIDLGLGTNHARLIETTDEEPATVVFDLTLHDPTGGRVAVYRSERIPDLYPVVAVRPPNGIGNSLRVDRDGAGASLSWLAAPVDAAHTAAQYYIVYGSTSPSGGFEIAESTAALGATLDEPVIEFYKVVAANAAGTSPDKPPLAATAE